MNISNLINALAWAIIFFVGAVIGFGIFQALSNAVVVALVEDESTIKWYVEVIVFITLNLPFMAAVFGAILSLLGRPPRIVGSPFNRQN
jgi:cytochrome bd-type quinol oxidase subunit 1